MKLQSIKWRLQLWHGLLLLLLLSVVMAGFYAYERRALVQRVDDRIMQALHPIMPRLAPPGWNRPEGAPGDGRRPPPRRGELLPRREPAFDLSFQEEQSVYYVLWAEDGSRLAASPNAPADVQMPFAAGSEMRMARTRGPFREIIHFGPSGRCLIAGMPLEETWQQLRRLAAATGAVAAAILVGGLAVGWWLASRALRPIHTMSEAAREIAAGDLSRRIHVPEKGSELGRLAAVLNATFARLEASFTQQRQFTSDAAHELRTPVAVILAQAQGTLRKERTAKEYRDSLEACLRSAQRMRQLIESLLILARWDAGQESIRAVPCDCAQLGGDSLALVEVLATERGVTLKTDLAPAHCNADPERMSQVLTNLLSNAILHNRMGGEVCLSTGQSDGFAFLKVSDNGPGIPQEALPHVFERFYRVDASRSGKTGGTGLGLAISKAIVDSHGGTIEVASERGKGASFTVKLPAAVPGAAPNSSATPAVSLERA